MPAPGATERSDGVRPSEKSGTVTVTFTVVVRVIAPLTPVMVSVLVPGGVAAPAVTANVEAPVVGLGVNSALAPEGNPDTLSDTGDENPPLGVMAMA